MSPRLSINRHNTPSKSDKILVAFVLLCLCTAQDVFAQISGTATVVSDYRYRGVSLSEGNPAGQLSLGYDSPAGWYAGGLISGVKFDNTSTEQFIGYAGYAGQVFSGLSWDAGISSTSFRKNSDYNYNEAYVGLTTDNYSTRLYYSPSYFYQNARTVYGEINAARPLLEDMQLLFHLGLLHQLTNSDTQFDTFSSRYDYRIGLNTRVGVWNFQLALVGLQRKTHAYAQYEDLHPHSWLLSAAYSF